MKCEVCLTLLEEYFDGALIEFEAERVSAHLITCAGCANELDVLTAEQEIYAGYDRGLEIAPSMWNAIAARTTEQRAPIDSGSGFRLRAWVNGLFAAPSLAVSLAGAIAVVLFGAVIGLTYLRTQRQQPTRETVAVVTGTGQTPAPNNNETTLVLSGSEALNGTSRIKTPAKGPVRSTAKSSSSPGKSGIANQSDVLFSEVAYSAAEEQDTQKHIEQAQNLLRSVRNLEVSDEDGEIDVSYEKALSRRLLNENVVLRRDAEMSGKFPVKTLLSSLEPFLIDIANLPDKTTADDLRVIKERVQKTEIVAALHSY